MFFVVENSVETFKDVAKVEHLWKKRETILENLLHNKIFGFCQRKKDKLFFLKDLCEIYFVQKTKRTFLKTSCWKSKCWLVWFTKRKRKTRPLFTKLRLKWQNSAHFVWGSLWPKTKQRTLAFGKRNSVFLFCLFQSCFFFQVSKMNEAKNKQTRTEVFFLFVKTTRLLCKTMKHFFVSQLSKINKPLV